MKQSFTLPGTNALLVAAMLAVPSLAAAQQAPLDRALAALTTTAARQGLSAQDLASPAVTSHYTDAATGLTHVYLRQRHQGIEVYGAVANVTVAGNGRVVALNQNFVAGTVAKARTIAPTLTPAAAVAAAARALNMPAPRSLSVEQAGQPAEGMTFSNAGISLEKIPVKLMYQPMASGELTLAWDVTLAPLDGAHYWNVRVDAQTGALLDKDDYTISEPVSFAEMTQHALSSGNWQQVMAPTTANKVTVPNSYNVYPLTIESPSHGARQVVVNPVSATFSPFGWHDVNGVAGADSTNTKGNNVFAYLDRGNTNTYRKGNSPDGGPTQIFDFPFDAALQPEGYKDAAITNLFYWNNLMHDVMAAKGFTEEAGNFQVKNYGSISGVPLPGGDDQVLAEAQDGAGLAAPNLNNANFSAPPDGTRPRMQMYLWDKSELTINVTAPSTLAGALIATEGSIGRRLIKVGPVTGNLVLVNDGSATPTFGCTTPYTNAADVNGNIALIDRGTCNFGLKVKNAQLAGARMVVVIDNVVGGTVPISMGGSPDTVGVRIPSVAILKSDGDRIKAALQAGSTVSLSVPPSVTMYRDGDFDNGIIAHEFGHGISIRLTGGRLNASCLNNAEQMGEGWSDFFGLWMTTKVGDVGTTGRGIGTYATFEPTTGRGIRPTRYSTDMTINPSTYALIGTTGYGAVTGQQHAIGYVWCTALWDLNWALIGRYGYNANLTANTGGNNIAMRLVMEGLKLQSCRPGFLDGRNAILKADTLLNGAANASLIWRTFARRGMGFNAVQGLSNSTTDNTAGFSLPTVLSSNKRLSEQMLEVYPNPARDQVVVRTQVSSKTAVSVQLLTLMGQVVRTQSVSAASLQQNGATVNTAELANGVYVVRLTTSEGTITKKVAVQH